MPLVEQATTEPNLLCYEELLAGTHDRYAWRRRCNGGLASPPAMIRKFRDADGMHVMHVWSMTEMSPIGTVEAFKAQHSGQDDDGRLAVISTQGCTVCGEDIKIVGEDGADLPWGGRTWGALPVRGPWVIETNFKGECGDPLGTDADGNGWFPTGDAAKITSERCLVITDRSKDVLKSGGEWIGSIDLENIAMAHLVVAMAACIATPHPKMGRAPLLVVLKNQGMEASHEELVSFHGGKIARWWAPDNLVLAVTIPMKATGKMQKNKLREQFQGLRLPA